ncbi:hypothetical protein P4V86_08975 [Brevibacillus laterosporus]|uniref:Uncharacterized protein n=1 Tax=Brevibacillus laterosporus TaxID=1465 RepID=A0AAP3DBR6_BRELA|nr:hypothetical protein [Brevibacillus laterosporus]MCR8978308.1 hypothetical protein [Brevibacillus laterosporus]MCZ0805464.1 hypothetical protein [Brevibacillus laterosporus]MCZ0823968.1 hypothetical protein [Brevibacillus laterosporus]MCZ0848870.1 hypothetical protein [Brevibacillus laterosporus]MED1662533.1 hypothetical protein [Brevibacillus laterosporus]
MHTKKAYHYFIFSKGENALDNQNDHFVKHGGVHFRNNVPPQEINNFIRKLPAGKRESLFEVLDKLEQSGLITVYNDHIFTDGNGVIGGGEQ